MISSEHNVTVIVHQHFQWPDSGVTQGSSHPTDDFTHLGENEPSHSCQSPDKTPAHITHVSLAVSRQTSMTVEAYGCLEVGDFLSLLLHFSEDERRSDSLRESLDDKTYSSINTDMKYVPGNSLMKIQNANLKK